jgi:hypothetical protein
VSKAPRPREPLTVRLIDADVPSPVETQTLEFTRENINISRNSFRLAVFGLTVAVLAAILVAAQIRETADQIQIMAAQSESAAAGAANDELNTRKQLAIAQKQADAAKKSLASLNDQLTVMKESVELTDRPWITVEMTHADAPGGALGFDDQGRHPQRRHLL